MRRQGGFTTIELLLGMTFMIVVLGATLSAFEVFTSNTLKSDRLTQAQDDARGNVDTMVATLRNGAAPTGSNVILRADATDLVINTDRPGFGIGAGTAGTARYCLDSAATGTLWFNWTPSPNAAPGTSCPSAGWTQRTIATGTRNQSLGQALFNYDSATLSAIRAVRMDLIVGAGAGTRTTRLKSAAAIRSLVDRPFVIPPGGPTATCGAGGVLNFSAGVSEDENGNPLDIKIFDALDAADLSTATQIGAGPNAQTATLRSGARKIVFQATTVLGQQSTLLRDVTCP